MIDLHSWYVTRLAILAVTVGSISAAASGQIAGNASTGAGWQATGAAASSTSTTPTLSPSPTSMGANANIALRAAVAPVGQFGYEGALPFAYGTTVSPSLNAATRARQFATHPIGGISWDFRWSDLEPTAGSFNWGELDRAIAAAAAVHMPSLIRVISGPDSPRWVLSSVPTVEIPNKYFPNPHFYANPTRLPVGWSAAYLRDWEVFVRAFGARYDGNRSIHVVEITGPSIWGDMYLPPDMTVWRAAGYSDAALVSAWHQVIQTYEAAFPHTAVGLGLAEPFICGAVSPGFVNRTCAPSYSSNVLGPVYAWIAAAHSSHLWLQQNNLKGSNLGRVFPLRRMIEQAATWTSVGYQMGGTASGAEDLHDAFEVARQDYANYVEVYMADIENSTYAPDLRWLRNG